jgi:hypothetical protein
MAPSADEYSQAPGSMLVEKIAIIPLGGSEEFEISTGGWLGFSIHEDILDSIITGTIEIQDTQNLPQLLNLKGGEFISIVFRAPGLNSIFFSGNITKIGEGVSSPPYARVYIIEFASSELISSTVQNIKQIYKGPCSDTVRKIFDNYLATTSLSTSLRRPKQCFIEGTFGPADEKINITGWTPITALRRLAAKALPANPAYRKPTFLFFERCDDGQGGGGFFFTSLGKLWSMPPVRTYNKQVKNLDMESIDDYFSINWLVEEEHPDLITNIKKGAFGRSLLMNDLVKRMTTTQDVNTIEEIMLNEENPLEGALMDFPEAMPVEFHVHAEQHHSDGKETYVVPHPEILKIVRKDAMNRLLFNQVVRIGVPGDSERTIGEIINLSIISSESPAHGDPPEDKFLSGKYIITALAHIVNGVTEKYETVMELSKDSNISV